MEPVIPDLTTRQARLLLTGVGLFYVGIAVAGLLAVTGRPPLTILVSFAGAGLAVLGGGVRFVPSTPRQLLATSRIALWPPVLTTTIGLVCVAGALLGVLAAVLSARSGA